MIDRRDFIKKTSLSYFTTLLGVPIINGHLAPLNWAPLGLLNSGLEGKDSRLIVLNDRPINAETPPHLLNDDLTPASLFFVRNNGIPPKQINPKTWTLEIAGESVLQSKTYTIDQLKSKFNTYSYHLTLECGGNGRKEFNPPAKGNQWSTGAVACAKWTGVRLRDVLKDAGIKNDAQYIGYYGKDTHLSGQIDKVSISRGVPISKAMEEESLIAWALNDEDLPILNGHPLRLVFGGWPASCSGKWLYKIVVRNQVHDGQKMGGMSYRVPCKPVAPGSKLEEKDMCIIESMPVKSLITYPKTGASIKEGQALPIRGHAWAGDNNVESMEYSIDFGQTWKKCNLKPAINRLAWQHFDARVRFPSSGYYEVWARAKDSTGSHQPMILPGWNPKGYLNNACHRIAVRIV